MRPSGQLEGRPNRPYGESVDPVTRLALLAGAGDEQALEEFVGATYDQVWRLCAALVDEQSGEDLAQDVYLRAVRALPRFRGDSTARTWLLAITRHACVDELRARSRRRRDSFLLLRAPSVELTAPDASQEISVTDLISRLEIERRIAFALTQMIGLTYEEAATVCECPVGTIRSRVARARADLLALLGESSPDGVLRDPKGFSSA